MLYDVQKLTSAYDRNTVTGMEYGMYPEAGVAYVERRQLGGGTEFPLQVVPAGELEVRVTEGYVNNVLPIIDGDVINADPFPTLPITNNATNYIILNGTYVPSTVTLGASFIALGSFGTVSDPEFTVSTSLPTTELYPTVTGTTASNGVFKAVFAVVEADDGAMTITQLGLGNAIVLFMPPDRYVVFRNTHANSP